MKFDQFIRPGQGKPLHSNGLTGSSLGSAGGAGFGVRKQVDGRRSRVVGRYAESKLANMESQREEYRDSRSAGSKIDIVRPTRNDGAAVGSQPPSRSTGPRRFTEPTPRPRPN
ncbi:MAG TPA: hypothetical protein PKD19_04320 [Candidatus Saccharibacteria bacterium]|nr:hypothetical protein [Candidatus Saccharibacteria bacterium]HMR38510.1 hypothetical protein [Candidatus Saccharibacteria bacterium]